MLGEQLLQPAVEPAGPVPGDDGEGPYALLERVQPAAADGQ